MKIKRDVQVREEKPLTAAELVACYKAVFGDSKGQIVYNDLIYFIEEQLSGSTNVKGGIDFRLPHHELAACAALTNLRNYIIAMATEGEVNE